MTKSTEKDCIYCSSKIDRRATVCKECGRSLNKTANRVTWLSGAVGLVAFVGSALLFLSSSATTQWARIYGANIEVLNVSSQKSLTLFNSSPVDVLVENITFSIPGGIELFVVVNQSLASGASSNTDIGALFEAQTTGPFNRQFGRSSAGRQVIMSEQTDNRIKAIQANLEANDYGWDTGAQDRFTVEAINAGGSDWTFFGAENADYLCVECSIEIRYRVARGGSFSLKPPCVGVVKFVGKPEAGGEDLSEGTYRLEKINP